MSRIVAPILLRRENKRYILLNVIVEIDGSIYFTFPKKPKRHLLMENEKTYSKVAYIQNKRILKELDKEKAIIDPKISFHPRDMIVHVNTNSTKEKGIDYPILNAFGSEHKKMIYLLQVIFPNDLDCFDEYNKHKHNDYIEIDYTPVDDNFKLEFVIHSNDVEVFPHDLPYSKNREYRFGYNLPCEQYSFSVFCSTIKNCDLKEILININTKEKSCIYLLN